MARWLRASLRMHLAKREQILPAPLRRSHARHHRAWRGGPVQAADLGTSSPTNSKLPCLPGPAGYRTCTIWVRVPGFPPEAARQRKICQTFRRSSGDPISSQRTRRVPHADTLTNVLTGCCGRVTRGPATCQERGDHGRWSASCCCRFATDPDANSTARIDSGNSRPKPESAPGMPGSGRMQGGA